MRKKERVYVCVSRAEAEWQVEVREGDWEESHGGCWQREAVLCAYLFN